MGKKNFLDRQKIFKKHVFGDVLVKGRSVFLGMLTK